MPREFKTITGPLPSIIQLSLNMDVNSTNAEQHTSGSTTAGHIMEVFCVEGRFKIYLAVKQIVCVLTGPLPAPHT